MELSIRDLRVTLGGRVVLDGVNAVLRPGRITAILGPNGAGKTTLLKTLAALTTPIAGGAALDGRTIATFPPRARARLIGYLPQDGRAHWNMLVRDVVALGRAMHRSPFAAPDARDHAAIAAALHATGTIAFADRPIDTLSGGERARVLLARALAGEPAWLLADEPLASLDPAHQLDMLDRLRDVAVSGRGVAIVLHDLLQAGRIADDVLLLRSGAVVAFGPAADVLTATILRAAFDIDVAVTQDAAGRPLCIATARA